MTKTKFKVGDRVRVANKWATTGGADVEIGSTGTVVTTNGNHCYKEHIKVSMDDDPVSIPWLIPPRGLKLIS